MIRTVLLSVCINLSLLSFARPTPEIPNARTLFRKQMKAFKSDALKVSFIPIVNLISIPQWKKYSQCKDMYFYFKSAHILSNRRKYKQEQIQLAMDRINKLLEQLKQRVEKIKDKRVHLSSEKNKAQKALNNRIKHMNINTLIEILDQGDRMIPRILITPGTYEAKYNSKIFREALTTVTDVEKFFPRTIYEASLLRERAEIKAAYR